MTDPAKDAERLARLRQQRDDAPIRYSCGVALAPMVNFQWIDVDFLFQQLDRLTQERDDAKADHVRVHKDKCDALDRIRELDTENQKFMREVATLKEEKAASQPTSGDVFLKPLTDEQQEYLRALDANARNYDPETIIGDPGAEQRRLTAKVDDVERAREIVDQFPVEEEFDAKQCLIEEVAEALTAARHEDARLRALDEVVIEAARKYVYTGHWTSVDEQVSLRDILRRALAARDAVTDEKR